MPKRIVPLSDTKKAQKAASREETETFEVIMAREWHIFLHPGRRVTAIK